MNDGIILFGELISLLEQRVIGKSTSYHCGWVRVEDIYAIADDIKSGKINKFGKQDNII